MKIRTQLTIRRMLQHYARFLESKEARTSLKRWVGYFSREELITILVLRFGKEVKEKYNLHKASSEEILFLIEDEIYLVQYILRAWEATLNPNLAMPITRESIDMVLDQLQLPIHYLRDKPINELDEYDRSNAQNLFRKAGVFRRVYGIYDSSVKVEEIDTVTQQPQVYFDSELEAFEEFDRILLEENFQESELKIFGKEIFLHPF